jgi:RHO1 GDP-GTP exchange protein 1/2
MLRYQALLMAILAQTSPDHEDQITIPKLLGRLKDLVQEAELGIANAKRKVKLWEYSANLVFKPGEHVDMDLLDDKRSLLFAGKLIRQADTGSFVWNRWSQLFCFLFDNYCELYVLFISWLRSMIA